MLYITIHDIKHIESNKACKNTFYQSIDSLAAALATKTLDRM